MVSDTRLACVGDMGRPSLFSITSLLNFELEESWLPIRVARRLFGELRRPSSVGKVPTEKPIWPE